MSRIRGCGCLPWGGMCLFEKILDGTYAIGPYCGEDTVNPNEVFIFAQTPHTSTRPEKSVACCKTFQKNGTRVLGFHKI